MSYDIYQIGNEYLAGASNTELCKKYGVSDEKIRRDLIKLNIPRRGSRKHFCNDTIFNRIDTADKAYWLGFIYADGNVYKNELSIKIGVKDHSHLLKFKEFMEYTGKIELTEKYSRIRISSTLLCSQLLTHGVYPNKGQTIKFPDLPEEFIRDFIRGFLDGDGWITSHIRKTEKSFVRQICFSSCSLEFIQSIHNILLEVTGEKCGSIVTRNRRVNWNLNYTLSFGANKSNDAIAEFLWRDAQTFLERKNFLLLPTVQEYKARQSQEKQTESCLF